MSVIYDVCKDNVGSDPIPSWFNIVAILGEIDSLVKAQSTPLICPAITSQPNLVQLAQWMETSGRQFMKTYLGLDSTNSTITTSRWIITPRSGNNPSASTTSPAMVAIAYLGERAGSIRIREQNLERYRVSDSRLLSKMTNVLPVPDGMSHVYYVSGLYDWEIDYQFSQNSYSVMVQFFTEAK